MRRTLAALVLITGLASTACGGSSGSRLPSAIGSDNVSGAAATTSPAAGGLTPFFNCVRQHGVNVTAPDPGVDWAHWSQQTAERNPRWDAASTACQNLLPADLGSQRDLPAAQDLERLRSYAVCMRAHDIEMTDPDPNGNMQINGRLRRVTRAQLDSDPGYKAATAACKDKLPPDTGAKR
jgi:hypothetical protein